MRVVMKFAPVNNGETVWSQSAVDSLVGQEPRYRAPDGELTDEYCTVLRAWIEDDFVMVEYDVPDRVTRDLTSPLN